MKILVDKMPEEKYDCPYCRDKKNELGFGFNSIILGMCTWQDADHHCSLDEIGGCPYFTDLKEKNYGNH